ncbi:MAG: Rieske 2Fe-2S domain-containing protein [Rhodoferax sp.]|nr:Rieske 2Fe-2S domain-containing protein [Rhodoferax sp.]
MTSPAPWHPVLPAHAVRAAAPPVALRLQGEDLVAWRTASGAVQVWHARCPHRSVHLALGRVTGERLACAYHGWEFEAGSARCVAIPALADLAQVPGQVRASVCDAREAARMLWVYLPPDAHNGTGAPPVIAPDMTGDSEFLRSLTLRAGLAPVHAHLQALDFTALAPSVWQGVLAGQSLHLFTHSVGANLSALHAWWCPPPVVGDAPTLLSALRRLRSDIESAGAAC